MSNATALTEQTFANTIAQGVTLVDFWAEWCGPCRMLAPVVDELAADYAGKVVVGKVDVDSNQNLAVKYGVQSIPTLIVFKDGNEAKRIVGRVPKEEIAKILDAALA